MGDTDVNAQINFDWKNLWLLGNWNAAPAPALSDSFGTHLPLTFFAWVLFFNPGRRSSLLSNVCWAELLDLLHLRVARAIGQLSLLGELNHSISVVSLSMPSSFSAGTSESGIVWSERLEQKKKYFKILTYVILAKYASTWGYYVMLSMHFSPHESVVWIQFPCLHQVQNQEPELSVQWLD